MNLFFTTWIIFWNISRVYFFSLFIMQLLRGIVRLFFSNFFQSSFSDGKFIPSYLYFFIKGLIFVILSGFYSVTAYWKHLLSFLLMRFIVAFCFLYSQENLYMIHYNLDLFVDIYNTITEHNQGQTHCLLSILNYFDIYF